MGVSCQILINKVKDVYKPGQVVTGRVKFYVDEPTEYEDVVLSFLGKGKCKWTQGTNKQRHTYHGTEKYVTTLVNICNKSSDTNITLSGQYEYPFEFYLPENIPRSYQDRSSSIKYYIELKLVKPSFFSFNDEFDAEIPVYNYMKPMTEEPIIFGLQKTLFAPFEPVTPVVDLLAKIDKQCVSPGENIHLSYLVSNKTDLVITSVKTELYCYTKYTADCGRTKTFSEKVHNCGVETSSISEREEKELSCILPTLPELYSVTDSNIISKKYKVRVTVRLPMPHINATKEITVLIGDQKGSMDPCFEAEEFDGPPPSYCEAMKEEQNEDGE